MYLKRIIKKGKIIRYYHKSLKRKDIWYDVSLIDHAINNHFHGNCICIGKNTAVTIELENVLKAFISNKYSDSIKIDNSVYFLIKTKEEYKRDLFVELLKIPG